MLVLREVQQSVSAILGTDDYSILLPGEPELTTQDVPGLDGKAQIAEWHNQQKQYAVSFYTLPGDAAGTLDDAVAGAEAASALTVVDSTDVAIDGATAKLVQFTSAETTLWTMVVFTDDGQFITIAHSGDKKDQAFFDSFEIH